MVLNEGMPQYRNPFNKGRLIIRFEVSNNNNNYYYYYVVVVLRFVFLLIIFLIKKE